MDKPKRKTVRRLAAAVLAGSVMPQAGAGQPAVRRQAVDWLGQLRQHGEMAVAQPVARLQRRFRLGYRNACALARWLHHDGHWSLGSHGATLSAKEPA